MYGLGGIGKTQTAVEYAYKYFYDEPYYQWVFWVKADTKLNLDTGFANLARIMALPEAEDQNFEEIIRSVHRWLAQREGWLLIFDNADQPELLKPYRPISPNGRILVTSRAQQFDVIEIARPLEMEQMLLEEAVKFLFRRTERKFSLSSFEEESDDRELAAAIDLANELGCLPLALEQAGAYISKMKVLFGQYLKKYRQERLKRLERCKPVTGNYYDTVATTWLINFLEVEETSKAAADLLRFSAFLPSDEIPLMLIAEVADELGSALSVALANVDDTLVDIYETLEPLRCYSLVRLNTDNQTYSVHRLVQEVQKDEMDEDTRYYWAERTIYAVNKVFPHPGRSENLHLCSYLHPYAEAAANLVMEWNFDSPIAASFLYKASVFSYFFLSIKNFSIQRSEGYLRCQQALCIIGKFFSLGTQDLNQAATSNFLIDQSFFQSVFESFDNNARKFIGSMDLDKLTKFLDECKKRLDTVNLIDSNASKSIANACQKMILANPDLVKEGGYFYPNRRLAACLHDCIFIQRYVSYAILNCETSVLDDYCLNGLREIYVALGIPSISCVSALQTMKIDTVTLMSNDSDSLSLIAEITNYFDRVIAAII
ncbi:NB-ARC domain-containing protein [Aetokthonos hydrillicola]|uniref:DUF7779 domain-containing protein n=1 Tax=Aetokthonos hydrillicola TaxID=1550245 RepID=UPI0030DBE347